MGTFIIKKGSRIPLPGIPKMTIFHQKIGQDDPSPGGQARLAGSVVQFLAIFVGCSKWETALARYRGSLEGDFPS